MNRPVPGDTALEDTVELVRRTFTVALHEGLSRVPPPWETGRSGPGGSRPATPGAHASLLRAHREDILRDLAEELPPALAAAGHPDVERACPPLLGWARSLLTTAYSPAVRPGRPTGSLLGPAPQTGLTVATLLLECASRRLPDVPARAAALQALGRAARGAGRNAPERSAS